MRKTIITLGIILLLPFAVLLAQTETDILEEVIEIELNSQYSVRLKQISESEYTVRKQESEHLRHKPYKAITDFAKARKMLGKRIKEIEINDDEGSRNALEITFKDKTKKRVDWLHANLESLFIEYYPEVAVLILSDPCDGFQPIDLNDSDKEQDQVGHPFYHLVSPDRKFLINGFDNNACASEGATYFLEKWNSKKKKYEFVSYFYNRFEEEYLFTFTFATDWRWINNGKVLFKNGGSKYYEKYFEMEIIVN